MDTKTLIVLAVCIAAGFAISEDQFDFAHAIPRTEVPGFWDGRKIQPINTQGRSQHKYDRNGRIVGGNEVEPHTHPYQGGLFVLINWWTAMCGCVLLSSNIVITAAHCLENSLGATVVLGAHYLFNPFEPNQLRIGLEPRYFITHPDYNPSMLYNDISLIYLPNPVSFNAFIQPIQLPDYEMMRKDFSGEVATVSGWGRTSDMSSDVSEVLRSTINEVKYNPDCYAIFGNFVIDSTLCANTRDTQSGICNGDSGGPLTVVRKDEPVLIGVVSFLALAGCQLGFPSGFARMTYFKPWIMDHMERLNNEPFQ